MRDERLRKISLFFLLPFFISLLLFFFDQKGWLVKFKGFFSYPLVWSEGKIFNSYQGLKESFGNLGDVQREEEITQLEGKLRQLAVDQTQLSSCLEENERIKKLLGSPLPPQWHFLEARVIGQGEQMKIDKGQRDKVVEGMMVISENILLGRIVTVEENFSLVEKVNSPNVKIPVVVKKPGQASVQARGLLLGQYKDKLFLDRVLQGEQIQKGDLVITSGEENWLPDLLIGQIEEVLPKTAELYQTARVSPLVDYQELRIVFIIVK
jgi:rod shape-determining protein MreC